MRRFLILLPALLGACGLFQAAEPGRPGLSDPVPAEPLADPGLFEPAEGWTGPVPGTQGELALAVEAEIAGRQMCNGQLAALRQIYLPERVGR